jgi:hypothetical protein
MVNKWQVVTIATYSFFIACVFGRQYTEDTIEEISIDLFFPSSWTIGRHGPFWNSSFTLDY